MLIEQLQDESEPQTIIEQSTPKIWIKMTKMGVQSKEMPKFLSGKFTVLHQPQNQLSPDKGKKIFPNHKHGHSYESPHHFLTPHSLICKDSYQNPFLDIRRETEPTPIKQNSLQNKEFYHIQGQGKQNTEERKVFLKKPIDPQKYLDSVTQQNLVEMQLARKQSTNELQEYQTFEETYLQNLQENNFAKKKQPFTDFIEKNDMQNVYGHLNMRERPKEFRIVKDYALSPERLRLMNEARSTSPTTKSTASKCFTKISVSKNQMSQIKSINGKRLATYSNEINDNSQIKNISKFPKLFKVKNKNIQQKNPNEEEDYLNLDQYLKKETFKYKNKLQNSIIKQQILRKIKINNNQSPRMAYNSDKVTQGYQEFFNFDLDGFERKLKFQNENDQKPESKESQE